MKNKNKDVLCAFSSYLPRHSSANSHRRRRAEQTHVDARRSKGGLFCRHGNVTAGHKLAASGRGNTIHHGDHWNRNVLYQSHYLKDKRGWVNPVCETVLNNRCGEKQENQTSAQVWNTFVWYSRPWADVISFRSCPEENTGPLADTHTYTHNIQGLTTSFLFLSHTLRINTDLI